MIDFVASGSQSSRQICGIESNSHLHRTKYLRRFCYAIREFWITVRQLIILFQVRRWRLNWIIFVSVNSALPHSLADSFGKSSTRVLCSVGSNIMLNKSLILDTEEYGDLPSAADRSSQNPPEERLAELKVSTCVFVWITRHLLFLRD